MTKTKQDRFDERWHRVVWGLIMLVPVALVFPPDDFPSALFASMFLILSLDDFRCAFLGFRNA